MKHSFVSVMAMLLLSISSCVSSAQHSSLDELIGGSQKIENGRRLLIGLIQEKEYGVIYSTLSDSPYQDSFGMVNDEILSWAATYGAVPLVEHLLEKFNSHLTQASLVRSLSQACANNKLNVAEVLLRFGVNPSVNLKVEESGVPYIEPCIFFALNKVNVELVNLLILYDQDFDVLNYDGMSAGEYAVLVYKRSQAILQAIEQL